MMNRVSKGVAAFAAASVLVAGMAQAGGMAEPVMEPEVIVEETASTSAGGVIVPLLLLALIAAIASNNGGGGGGDVVTEITPAF